MKVTQFTRRALLVRRERREMTGAGWEFVGEGGGRLWELNRGARQDQRIVDVQIAACGKGVWVMIEPTPRQEKAA